MALYEFYGETCPHCIQMMPLVEQLISEGFAIERLEVWNNEANADKMLPLAENKCPGVPFFLNTDTDQFICGATDEETLRRWARGENVN